MTTSIKEVKDQIEFDILHRIRNLEHEVQKLRDKVLYDVPSKSERRQKIIDECQPVGDSQELIARLKLQNVLLKYQVNKLRGLSENKGRQVEPEEFANSYNQNYW